MKKLIKQYLTLSIKTKKGLNKEIERIDKVMQELAEIVANQNILIEEILKNSYKVKYLKEHKKYKELLKKYKEEVK